MIGNDDQILADRVAAITADAERKTSGMNLQLIAVITASVLFFGGTALYYMGGESTAAAPQRIIPQNAYTNDGAESNATLFGDAAFNLDDNERDEEVEGLKAQLSRLEQLLSEKKPSNEMPQQYRDELTRVRDEMAKMQENFSAQITEYQGYISKLETIVRESTELPQRPVSMRDDKWIRAQTISSERNRGEAARIAAPTKVFDASRKRKESEEDQEQLIEYIGEAFPTSEELEIPQ